MCAETAVHTHTMSLSTGFIQQGEPFLMCYVTLRLAAVCSHTFSVALIQHSKLDLHYHLRYLTLRRRYRTQLCNDGNKCKRHICFFAHSLDELRVPTCKPFVPPDALAAATSAAAADIARKVNFSATFCISVMY